MTDARDHGGAHPRALWVGLVTALVLVVLDQVTKELAESLLSRGEFVPWIGDWIGFELVYNPGGAFGVPAPAMLFLVVTVLVVVLVATSLPRSASLTAAVAYGMLLAGALGNAIDRVFRAGDPEGGLGAGYVVDFIAWGWFPRFNVADSSITVGFVLLAIAVLAEERRERRRSSPAMDGSSPPRAWADDGAFDDAHHGPAPDRPAPGADDAGGTGTVPRDANGSGSGGAS